MKLINCHHIKKWPLEPPWPSPLPRPRPKRRQAADWPSSAVACGSCNQSLESCNWPRGRPPIALGQTGSIATGGSRRDNHSRPGAGHVTTTTTPTATEAPFSHLSRPPSGLSLKGMGGGRCCCRGLNRQLARRPRALARGQWSFGQMLSLSLMCLIVLSDFQRQIANQCAQSRLASKENQSYNNNNSKNNNQLLGLLHFPREFICQALFQLKPSQHQQPTASTATCWQTSDGVETGSSSGVGGSNSSRCETLQRTGGAPTGSTVRWPPVILMLAEANSDANRLYEDLMMTYNKIVRPVKNNSDRVVVILSLKLSQLIDVNLKNQMMTTNVWLNQEWSDYKLKWDPSEYGGIKDMNLPAEQLWLPDIVLYNSAEGYFAVSIMTKAKVHYTGHVNWNPPAIFRSSCQIDITYFPFDSQHCHLKFGSWTYGTKIDLRHKNDTVSVIQRGTDLSEYYQNVEWDIMEASAKRNVITYNCCPNDFYPDVTFHFTLRRKPLFYTVNLILPCVGITILSFLVFYLPSDSGEKVTLTISILVSLIFFLSVLIETIPSTSLAMPLLGKYLVFTMILITLSVCATVCVLNIHFRTPSTHSMAPWVKRWCIEILPKYLFMTVPQHQSQQAGILPEQLIYPHNQAYGWSLTTPNAFVNQSSLVAGGQPLDKGDKRDSRHTNQQQQQQVNRYNGNNKQNPQAQLNPASLDLDIQKLNVSPSSLFLPYLQSEAARRLQLQRSRSSDRDQRSECLAAANAQINCDSSKVVYHQPASTTIDTQPAVSSSSASSSEVASSSLNRATGPKNGNTTGKKTSRKNKRDSGDHSDPVTKNKRPSDTGSNQPEARRKPSGSFWTGWFGGGGQRKCMKAPEVEIRGADSRVRGGNSDRPALQHDTSSSMEADYQHHSHFQARASICSTNLWRIGPTRRCSMAVPNNYPTYYRPQLLHPSQYQQQQHMTRGPDGQTELSTISGCLQGHYHVRGPAEDASSDTSSSSIGGFDGAVGALVTASATNLPVRPKSRCEETQFQYQTSSNNTAHYSNEFSDSTMRTAAGFPSQRMPVSGSAPHGFVQSHFPDPKMTGNGSHLLMGEINRDIQTQQLRRQQLSGRTLQQQHQQHSSGLFQVPGSLLGLNPGFGDVKPPLRSSSGHINQSSNPSGYSRSVHMDFDQATPDPPRATAVASGYLHRFGASGQPSGQPHASSSLAARANLLNTYQRRQQQQYHQQSSVLNQMMPRSRSSDHRLCNSALDNSYFYMPRPGTELANNRDQQLRPTQASRPVMYPYHGREAQLNQHHRQYQFQQVEQQRAPRSLSRRIFTGQNMERGSEIGLSDMRSTSSYNLQQHQQGAAGGQVSKVRQGPPLTALGVMKLISEVDKAIQNAMFIAQHIDNLDEFESVKENWKYIAMVIDRIFLIVFLFACIVGTVTIFAMAPWSYYTTEKPIDLQLTRLLALNLTGNEPYSRTCREP